jgi:hypothetical protein
MSKTDKTDPYGSKQMTHSSSANTTITDAESVTLTSTTQRDIGGVPTATAIFLVADTFMNLMRVASLPKLIVKRTLGGNVPRFV